MKLFKKCVRVNSIFEAFVGFLWLNIFLIYIIIIKGELGVLWNVMYPGGLLWCGGIGQVILNSNNKKTITVSAWIQIGVFFVECFFGGIGMNHEFKDAYRITMLLFLISNLLTLGLFIRNKNDD